MRILDFLRASFATEENQAARLSTDPQLERIEVTVTRTERIIDTLNDRTYTILQSQRFNDDLGFKIDLLIKQGQRLEAQLDSLTTILSAIRDGRNTTD